MNLLPKEFIEGTTPTPQHRQHRSTKAVKQLDPSWVLPQGVPD